MSHGAIKSHIVSHGGWITTSEVEQYHCHCSDPNLLSGQFNYIIIKLALWCLHGTRRFTYAGFSTPTAQTLHLTGGIRGFLLMGNSRFGFLYIVSVLCELRPHIICVLNIRIVATVADLPTIPNWKYASRFFLRLYGDSEGSAANSMLLV